jgi:hypothetical protein
MSIAATVIDVREGDDPALILGPMGTGDYPNDPPGQPYLHVMNRPCPPLRGFIGVKIWGDCSTILVGDKKIAKRVGYTKIELL